MKALALDIGGTKIAAAVVDSQFRLQDVRKVESHIDRGPDFVLDQIEKLYLESVAKYADLTGIGISSAGPLDLVKGEWDSPTNFLTNGKAWGRVPVVQPLQQRLKTFVGLDNDAACAVLGYVSQSRIQSSSAAVITLGTGVGIGVWLNGQLVRGRGVSHPEVSHIPLNIFASDAPCECGRKGCIESYLSSLHFSARVSREQERPLTTEQIVAAAQKGEQWALSSFESYASALAQTCGILETLYQPEWIVIAGGLAQVADLYLPKTQKLFALQSQSLKSPLPSCQIQTTPWTFELSLMGAAQLVFSHVQGQ